MALEYTLLMVKPDGITKGLCPVIRNLILQNGLQIAMEKAIRLTPEGADELYQEYKQRDYYPQLIEFITSQPVIVFLIHGLDAIAKVRRIIGKRFPPSGIRKDWAVDIIRNVAHGPDSQVAAKREIRLLFGKEVLAECEEFLSSEV